MIKHMFSTPVGFYELPVSPEMRHEVMNATLLDFYDLWQIRLGQNLSLLKGQIQKNAEHYAMQCFDNYMSKAKPVIVEGKINVQYPGDYFPLHSHSHAHIACVYYVTTPENGGKLLLVDPRGDTNWNDRIDGKYSNVSYQSIEPKQGMMIFFPSYVQHMVEPNKSDGVRVSVVTNLYMKR